MRNMMFTKPEDRAKPLWGLVNARTGFRWRGDAEKFVDAYPRKSVFESDQLLETCKKLFPKWFIDEPDFGASDCAARLSAGGYGLNEKAFRMFWDRESSNYLVMNPLEVVDHLDMHKSIAKTAQSKLALLDSLLQSGHVDLAQLPDEAKQKLVETYDLHYKQMVEVLTSLARDAQLTIADAVRQHELLRNGNGDSPKIKAGAKK